jgi:pimeloyl-ACP methyl ester carboxylesterase/tellurite resistance protein
MIETSGTTGPAMPAALPSVFSWSNPGEAFTRYAADVVALARSHARKLVERVGDANLQQQREWSALLGNAQGATLPQALHAYVVDLAQRQVLFLDALRRRGNDFLHHEEVGARPALAFKYEMILNGETLPRPVNYSLVRIVSPEGALYREDGRPYIIVDPRAGHGSGIGGFKDESEVGCALDAGHPVYFVVFSRHPEPGQTLASVCAAEAAFVREVTRRHPRSAKPVIIGNCQGGWAAMLLAATDPDITGPLVVNGAPLSYWAGTVGKNPMRYLGGVYGGALPALVLSDLGHGHFDGANLVLNFETLHPGRTWWKKHYDAFAAIDTEAERYLEFERWWSGFYFMSEAEIRWIVENLFVGNCLSRGAAHLEEGTHVDLRAIRSPIVVFASHGDNITPPQQALNWITDLYRSADEIRILGQRIVYAVHDSVGHLGIFVSSDVAGREHRQIVSALKAIEALSPGLYEMVITDEIGEGGAKRYRVAFEERQLDDIRALDDGATDEAPFGAVARLSALGVELYELTARPFVKAMVTPASAKASFAMHPLRVSRYVLSDRNPWMAPVADAAEGVRATREAASPDNVFLRMERLGAAGVTQWWDVVRDWNEFMIEWSFHALYSSPAARAFGASRAVRVSDTPATDPYALAPVQDALDRIETGEFAEAVTRMLVLLARARGSVRRSRLQRSTEILDATEPFASMKLKHRTRIIHRESIIVSLEPDAALHALPKLLPKQEERVRAMEICFAIAGPAEEMSPPVVAQFARFAEILGVEDPTARLPPPGAGLRSVASTNTTRGSASGAPVEA